MITFRDPFDQYGEFPWVSGSYPTAMQANGYVLNVTPNGGIGIGAAFGRFPGSLGLQVKIVSNAYRANFAFPSYPNQATQYKGIGMYFATVPGDDQVLFAFADSATTQIDFRYRTGGIIQITRNGTVVATAGAGSISAGQWYWVEMKVTVDPSAGFAEWKQNGVSIISFTGNTRASSNSWSNGISCIGIGTNNSPILEIWLDDAVQYNPTGAAPTTYTGDKRYVGIKPNAAGDVANFTPAWASWAASTVMAVGQQILDSNGNVQRVTAVTSDAKTGTPSHPTWATTGGNTTTDNHVTWTVVGSGANPGAANWMAVAEAPPDGDNSYNASSTIGNIDRFVGPGVPSTLSGILEVVVCLYQRKDDAGVRSTRASINSGGTVADNGADFTQSSSYVYSWGSFTTDPNTAAAWTVGAVNGLTGWGYKVTA